MLFRKESIRRSENKRLVEKIHETKAELDRYEEVLANSIEPSEEVLIELKLWRSKYIFLMKEARYRKVNGYKNT
ncbi:YaaL family protein [Alteribacillus iranensis]|uniref:DUF2508 domain-containing protein n=1 Tax=Alteribacillus iranensis TaxID=930128 RepID=A0A1I2C8P6_9BACI|nr:YaaL family protein [Alteribacillus iranensis]SFE64040.1 Protein of unknown function [Alteribacillus iranensis]